VRFVLPDGSERDVRVGEDEYILAAAYRHGLGLPSMCLQGWCLTCAGRVEGGGEWNQAASRRYFEEDREGGFILLCTAHCRGDLMVRTHQRAQMRDHRLRRGLPAPRG
jgi:ferredoxin